MKTRWVCQECGFQTSRSLGRCTECSNWNSFVEEVFEDDQSKKGFASRLATAAESSTGLRIGEKTTPLDQIEGNSLESKEFRLQTGSAG
ncbi:hypothetical protein ABTE36_21200, partial [Acinetobacter baumannii]